MADNFVALAILGLSIILQYFAAFSALRLIRVTQTKLAWLLIAAALTLMGIRRSITFFRAINGDGGFSPDITAEIVALVISVVMVAGVLLIGPLYKSVSALQEKLEINERRSRDFAEAASDWLWEMDSQLRFSYLSPRVEDVTGVPVEYHIGKTRTELTDENLRDEKWLKHFDALRRHEPFKNFTYSRIGPDGESQHISISGVPIIDENGTFAGYRGTGREITELHEKEVALEESEGRYRRAIQTAAIWDWDLEADTVFFSPLFNQMLGYEEDEFREILEGSIKTIVHPDDVELYLTKLYDHIDNPSEPFDSEHRFMTRNGDYRWFHAHGQYSPRTDGTKGRLAGVLIDVTDRKLADIALRDAFVLLRTILDTNPQYIYWKDTDLNLLGGNRAFAEAAGLPDTGAIVGKNDYDLPWASEETELYRKSDQEVISSGNPTINAVRTQRRADGRVMTIQSSKFPLRDSAGQIIGLVGTYQDITDHIRVERELEESRDRSEKANKSKSDFLASMSHELRTPLNAVLGYSQMLQLNLEKRLSDTQLEYIDHIISGGNHLLELVNDILDLARVEADKLSIAIETVNTNEVISECVSQSQKLAEPQNLSVVNLVSDEPTFQLNTDRLRFRQILINLLSNAVKYNRENGEIVVQAEHRPNQFVRISVTDTGIGIPQDLHSNVFEPFERINSNPEISREGTGIGLTVSRMLVERLGGNIGFSSELGKGSTFWFELPSSSNRDVLIWTDALKVGVDPIDRDHQVIASLYNRFLHEITKPEDIVDAVDRLVDYTHYHFRREEAIMKACGYPFLENHRKQHQGLLRKVAQLSDRLESASTDDVAGDIRNLLGSWLRDHITIVDQEIADFAAGKEREIRTALRDLT